MIVVGAGDVVMIKRMWLNSVFAIGMASTFIVTTPSVAQTFESPVARNIVTPVLKSSQREAMRGSCKADLAVESIELRKSGQIGRAHV